MEHGYNLITLIGAVAFCVCGCIIQADLTEYRIRSKRARILTTAFTVCYTILVIKMYSMLGAERGGQLYIIFSTVPMLVFFFLVSRYRDGRFLFSFFVTGCVSLSIICLTNLIDSFYPTKGHMVHTFLRLIVFPLTAFINHRYLAPGYRKIQSLVNVGWNTSALILGISYCLMLYTYNYPVLLFKRPYDIPVFVSINVCIWLFIISSTRTLLALQESHEAKKRQDLFTLQIDSIKNLIVQTGKTDERLKIERHNLRHRYNTLSGLLKENNISGALEYIDSAAGHLEDTKQIRYCQNTLINAAFHAYASIAEDYGIRLETELDIPEELYVNSEELSVVFANALENAINAVKKLPEEKRIIRCKCISHPQLMLQIKNPFEGKLLLNEEGIPISGRKGHGIGTWSIMSYCEKYNAICDYSVQENLFLFRLAHTSGQE